MSSLIALASRIPEFQGCSVWAALSTFLIFDMLFTFGGLCLLQASVYKF